MAERPGLLLIDTDMLVLLIASDLLETVAAMLGCTRNQLNRLSAAPYQVRSSKRFRDSYGESVLQRIEKTVAAIPEAAVPTDLELLDTLNSVVDVGEAQLMALAAAQECTLFLTADKRAVKELAESGATQCIEDLQGKIVSLEAVLWMLVANMSPVEVRDAFTPVLNHATLRIVLSEHAVADRRRCLEGIRSYYRDLNKVSKGLLFNPAPGELGE